MYNIEKYYDHFVIKQDDKILFHVDTLLEAETELEKIVGKAEKDIVERYGELDRYDKVIYLLLSE